MQCEGNFRFFTETPLLHLSCGVQGFIEQELNKPSKAWVHEVMGSKRERELVKLRTPEFVLLPDLTAARRQHRSVAREQCSMPCGQLPQRPLQRYAKTRYGGWPTHKYALASTGGDTVAWAVTQSRDGVQPEWHAKTVQQPREPHTSEWAAKSLNWLVIFADSSLRSIRDLRGAHVDMLEAMYEQCVVAIQKEYKVKRSDIMVFANYPPSVYRLHFHFCAPFFTSSAYDAFRMHPLSTIINNLKLCPDYYKLSSIQVPLHVGSELFRITNNDEQDIADDTVTM